MVMKNEEIIQVTDVVVVELDNGWYGIGFGCDGDTPLSLATVSVQFQHRDEALSYAINEYLKTGRVKNLVIIENDEAVYYELGDIDKLIGEKSEHVSHSYTEPDTIAAFWMTVGFIKSNKMEKELLEYMEKHSNDYKENETDREWLSKYIKTCVISHSLEEHLENQGENELLELLNQNKGGQQ
jgi:hypothetical protein